MTRLQRYQQQRAAVLDEMKAINEAAEASEDQDGRLSDEQETEYAACKERLTQLNTAIEREQEVEAAERAAPAIQRLPGNGQPVRTTVHSRADDDPRRGFQSHRHFFEAVMARAGHGILSHEDEEHLRPLAVNGGDGGDGRQGTAYLLPRAFNPSFLAAAGSDEQGGYDDGYGGFARGEQMLPRMLRLGFEGDPTAGRTQPVPMSAPTVKILARTDKNHSTSVSGGFTVARKPEAVAATSSRGEMEMVTLTASSLFGHAFATEEILTDSVISFIALINSGFRDQFAHHMLHEKIRGLGGAEYIGVVNAACTIAVSRDTSSRIVGTDVLAMRARCWNYGRAIWIANHDTFGELFRLGAAAYDAEAATPLSGSNVLYVSSMREDAPDMLLGRPIFYSEYASTLGSAGDLILGVWSEYLDGLYQPLRSDESMHVRWIEHERAFKFWLRNAGAPWWRSALTPEQSSTTLSPFVTIAA